MTGKGKPFKKGEGGRPKGAKNRYTKIKEALLEVFERKGGVDGLETWANRKENETKFYEFMMKLLPKDIAIEQELTVESKSAEISTLNKWLAETLGKDATSDVDPKD